MSTAVIIPPLYERLRLQLAGVTRYQAYDISTIIDDYSDNIVQHYQPLMGKSVKEICSDANIPYALSFQEFGLNIHFKKASELTLHNQAMELEGILKELLDIYGVIRFKNAYLNTSIREMYHRNNFQHLNFHRDRGDAHENKYSFYTRDPFDEIQQYPRTASTLFIDNAVAYLQAYVEGKLTLDEQGRRGHYNIFDYDRKEKELFNNIILEQPWDEPQGVGEICMINNNSVLHASYKHTFDPGYRIGARYLY